MIDKEIAEELEKYRVEMEIGGFDANEDSDLDIRLPESANEDFENAERQIIQVP